MYIRYGIPPKKNTERQGVKTHNRDQGSGNETITTYFICI